MRRHLNFQLCIFPLADGGFYANWMWDKYNDSLRVALWIVDFRIAWM